MASNTNGPVPPPFFESDQFSIVRATTNSITHNLGTQSLNVEAYINILTATGGYGVGDVIGPWNLGSTNFAGDISGFTWHPTSNNAVSIAIADDPSPWRMLNTTGQILLVNSGATWCKVSFRIIPRIFS